MRAYSFFYLYLTSLFTLCWTPQISLLNAGENDLQFWESPIPEQPELIEALVHSDAYKEYLTDPLALKFLVQVDEGKIRRQWIVSIISATEDSNEEKAEPKSFTYHTSTGDKFAFSTRPETLLVKTLGPIKEKRGKVKSSKLKKPDIERIEVPIDFLKLGFNHASEFALTMREKQGKFSLNISNQPFPEEVTKPNSQAATDIGITKDQLRSICATAPAYNAFFDLMRRTPGLNDIMKKMIDTPSLFSMLKNGIRINFASAGQGIQKVDPLNWGLAHNVPCYSNPVTIILNEKPGLNVRLIVTVPQAPFNLSAGVVGMVASSPDHPERVLFVRLLSASNTLGESS